MSLFVDLKCDYERYSKGVPSAFSIAKLALSKAGFRAVFLYRIGRVLYLRKFWFLAGFVQRIMHHTCHCYISVSAEIGAGFLIAHVGGIIIGGKTKIGTNCDIRQNVTFGGNFNKKSTEGRSQPLVDNNVSIGVGACILGPVHIGEFAIIGANSVVTRDVSPGMISFGVPAKEIKKRWDKDIGRKL